MDERINNIPQVMLMALVKALPIQCCFTREDNGSCTGFITGGVINASANAAELDACRSELVSVLRESADAYFSDFSYWVHERPDELPYMLKIIVSSDEELLSCLTGEN